MVVRGFSGVLLPDIYTFRIEHFVGGGNDPLGDHSEGEWDMRLSVSNAVPDAGSSALLLGVGLVGSLAFGEEGSGVIHQDYDGDSKRWGAREWFVLGLVFWPVVEVIV